MAVHLPVIWIPPIPGGMTSFVRSFITSARTSQLKDLSNQEELWDAKDDIAKEHGYSMEALAAYYLDKQSTREARFCRHEKSNEIVGKVADRAPRYSTR